MIRMSVWKRDADITYSLPMTSSFESTVDNVSPGLSSEVVSSRTHFALYDRLFHQPLNQTLLLNQEDHFPSSNGRLIFSPPPQRATQLKELLILHVTNKLNAYWTKTAVARYSLYMLPWLIQPQGLEVDMNMITDDNWVEASVCKTVYRLQLSLHSFYIFTTFSTVTLAWCLMLVVQSAFRRVPRLSAFPEVDLLAMATMTEPSRLSSRLGLMDIPVKLGSRRIYVRQKNNENRIGMQDEDVEML